MGYTSSHVSEYLKGKKSYVYTWALLFQNNPIVFSLNSRWHGSGRLKRNDLMPVKHDKKKKLFQIRLIFWAVTQLNCQSFRVSI